MGQHTLREQAGPGLPILVSNSLRMTLKTNIDKRKQRSESSKVKALCHLLQFPKIQVLKVDIEEHRALQTAQYAF